MSSLHRRQSALNLPFQSSSELQFTGANSRKVRSPLAILNLSSPVKENTNDVDDQEPSPTSRDSYDEKSKRRPQNELSRRGATGRGTVSVRWESTPESYDRTFELSQQRSDTHRSSRSSQAGSQTHLRTLSRDFVLPSVPTSSVRHENCSSLKDQFLKIKERFSPSISPLNTAAVAPCPLPVENVVAATANHFAAVAASIDTVAVPSSSETLAVSIQGFPSMDDEGSWEFPQARVERWYREDDFFKACITCWTMEAGAAIVSKVARVVSEWTSGNVRSPTAGGSSNINPDVSLQWIGRQLWAVTVSLPLTRSGELHEEHITLAHLINRAVADISKRPGTHWPVVPSDTTQELQTTPANSCPRDQPKPVESTDVQEAKPLSPIAVDDNVEDPGHKQIAALQTSPFSTLVAEDIELLQASQTQLAHKNCGAIDENAPGTACRRDEQLGEDASTERDQNDEEEEEEDIREELSALPLSWSMLSLSSQPSGSSEHTSLQGEFTMDEDSIIDPVANLAPEKTGWLKKKKRKQHGIGSSWQPRYFELKGNRLYYFASEADGLPRGAVLLDHALVQRGRGDHAMALIISSASSHRRLQVLKFSARLTHQVHPRKSIELRVVEETEASVSGWIAALNRASFYCKLANATAGCSATLPLPSSSSFGPFTTPDSKRKTPFYRFRSPTTTKSTSLPLSAERERRDVEDADSEEIRTTTARWTASYQQLGSVRYLRETDPLLWEIHPPEQIAIRKKAARARTRADYLAIFSRHAETFAQIFLPRPQPISLEQTLRDILPELFLINDTLYGGGEQQQAAEQNGAESGQPQQSRGLEHIFEVLDAHIQRFAAAPEERVRAVSALLQACARTISGGDSYFVVHRLLGNPNLIIRPAEARGRPIEIDVSPERPSHFLITVFSAFSFHLLDDVERFGDSSDPNAGAMTPAPLLRVRTRHIQEFDFASGTSTRWLRIEVEGRKEDNSPGGGGVGAGALGRWGTRRQSHEAAESRIGALLDALS